MIDERIMTRRRADGERGVFAARAFAAGEAIGLFEGALVPTPTRLSLQVGRDLHVEPGDHPLGLLNHSCAPNAAFRERALFAARALAAGEEIVLDYNCHEADMSAPFDCACGAEDCVGRVAGWNRLSPAQRASRRGRAASWLRSP